MTEAKKRSIRQERRVAKEIKGRTVVASGALWGSKGDARSDKFLVECKTTEKDFYSLTLETWDKIEKEAIKDGLRVPVMCVDLEKGKNKLAVINIVYLPQPIPVCRNLTVTAKSAKIRANKAFFQINFPKVSPITPEIIYKSLLVLPWEEFLEMSERIE